jgi:monoamine oxidase
MGLAAGTALAPTSAWTQVTVEPEAASRLKVESAVVIGGGIAGLSAAYALAKKGKQVTLLEQYERPGGLLRTRRWSSGQYSEDGAEEINDTDTYLWPLIEELGVETVELVGTDAVYFRSVYSESDSFEAIVGKLPLATKAKEDLWKAIKEIETIQEGFRHPFTNPAYHAYDAASFQTWLADRGWHPDVNRLLDMGVRAEACASTAQLNAFEGINLYALVRNARWFHFRGGNDTFAAALAGALGPSVRLGCEVLQVKQAETDVEVTYRAEGQTHTLRADTAILAVPSRAAAQIAIDLPAAKKQALLAVPYHTYLNPALRFRERFWKTTYGMKTWALNTDTPLNYVIDQTYGQPGEEGILVLHIVGDDGAAYSSLSDQRIIDLCLDQLASFWPRAREFYLEGHVSRLGTLRYPYQRPGFLRHLAPRLAEPVGRFFFCGDYTNGEGDLNGACFSGKQVVERFLA